ncbi:MAG: DinB family protein [Candidatus Thorarchaeota archaeon]|jgi:uncharacterized damage-inducible protein DinB
MLHQFLSTALKRHLDETMPLIEQLTDGDITKVPVKEGRPLGEVVLHMLRSVEYYLVGLTRNEWAPLAYSIEEYSTADSVKTLARDVINRALDYVKQLSDTDLARSTKSFNRPATAAEILLELIEHSIHHRGQITVYYRLLGIDLPSIPYII